MSEHCERCGEQPGLCGRDECPHAPTLDDFADHVIDSCAVCRRLAAEIRRIRSTSRPPRGQGGEAARLANRLRRWDRRTAPALSLGEITDLLVDAEDAYRLLATTDTQPRGVRR